MYMSMSSVKSARVVVVVHNLSWLWILCVYNFDSTIIIKINQKNIQKRMMHIKSEADRENKQFEVNGWAKMKYWYNRAIWEVIHIKKRQRRRLRISTYTVHTHTLVSIYIDKLVSNSRLCLIRLYNRVFCSFLTLLLFNFDIHSALQLYIWNFLG